MDMKVPSSRCTHVHSEVQKLVTVLDKQQDWLWQQWCPNSVNIWV